MTELMRRWLNEDLDLRSCLEQIYIDSQIQFQGRSDSMLLASEAALKVAAHFPASIVAGVEHGAVEGEVPMPLAAAIMVAMRREMLEKRHSLFKTMLSGELRRPYNEIASMERLIRPAIESLKDHHKLEKATNAITCYL
jgi:hypothetical protein